MTEALQKACGIGGRLISVREALLDPDTTRISDIELKFEHCVIVVSALEEFDTISIQQSILPDTSTYNPSADPLWNNCFGKQLQWAWILKNHQGYTDGVRFEFFDPDATGSVIRELIVAAAGLDLFASTPKV